MKTYFIVLLGFFCCLTSCISKDKKEYGRNIKYNLEKDIFSASIVEKDFTFLIEDDGKKKEIVFSGNGFKFTMWQPYSKNMNYISQTLQLNSESYDVIKSNISNINVESSKLKNISTLSLSYFLSFQICKTTVTSDIRKEYDLLEKIARKIIKNGNLQDVAGCYLFANDSISMKITADIFKTLRFSDNDDMIFHEMKIDSLLAIYPEILVIDTSRYYLANNPLPKDYNIFFKWRDSIGTVTIELE